MKTLFCYSFCWLLFSGNYLQAQDNYSEAETLFHEDIRTIMLYRAGWELTFPVIIKGEPVQLELRFDYLGENSNTFSYAVTNCTYDWRLNPAGDHEYIEGFNDITIDNSTPSRNTTTDYINYFAKIPGEGLKITQSGNYLLKVFETNNQENVFFTRRFCIAEKLVEIDAQVKRYHHENQELMISVDLGRLNLMNPLEEVKVVVLRNYDWYNQIPVNSPPYLRNNKLHFDLPGQIAAEGLNEYRYFNTKTTLYSPEGVEKIEYIPPSFHFTLKTDELRGFLPYYTSEDLNGRYYIDLNDAYDRHTEADYMVVNFKLDCEELYGMNIYLYGALTDWRQDETNRMVYNNESGGYEKTLLLKQGLYNYLYMVDSGKETFFSMTEGSHSETENDYIILVYLRETMGDFDRLVGYELIESNP